MEKKTAQLLEWMHFLFRRKVCSNSSGRTSSFNCNNSKKLKSQVIWESRKFNLSTGKVQWWIPKDPRYPVYPETQQKRKTNQITTGFLFKAHRLGLGHSSAHWSLIGPKKKIPSLKLTANAPENGWFPSSESPNFQGSIFRCELLVSGRVLVGGWKIPLKNYYFIKMEIIFPNFSG